MTHTFGTDAVIVTESAEVNQAVGMISVQANCPIEQAFALMFGRAHCAGLSLEGIAAAVLYRSITFASTS
jgi:hypothetical protein